MTRRNKLEMMYEVIKAARNVGITKLMNASNVKCTVLHKEILPTLIERGLIKVEGTETRPRFIQTPKGIDFVKHVRAAYTMIGEVWK